MGKSLRKNPISGITCARSEKKDKRLCNRILRHRNKIVVRPLDEENIEGHVFDIKDDAMNKYCMDKDGKRWIDPKKYPKVKRK